MNEISRCCHVLGVKHGASLEEVKKAYRDLVQVWHPDRFANNERLRLKAEEHTKEINRVYEHLVTNAFQDGFLVEPEETAVMAPAAATTSEPAGEEPMETPNSPEPASAWPDEPLGAPEPTGSRAGLWLLIVLAVALGSGALWYVKGRKPAVSSNPESTSPEEERSAEVPAAPKSVSVATAVAPPPADLTANTYAFSRDLLPSMTVPPWSGGWLETAHLLTPPFVIRTKVTLIDLVEFRLAYGLGRVAFNPANQRTELQLHDLRNFNTDVVPAQGSLSPGLPHEVVWDINTNMMSVFVDGKVRYTTRGDFASLKGMPSINRYREPAVVTSFVVETPQPLSPLAEAKRDHGPMAGDLLASMQPEKNLRMLNQPDGRVLWMTGEENNRLWTTQKFEPPFVIRTRAKTEGLNIRLYWGSSWVIFNWEGNTSELRVKNPQAKRSTIVPDKGFITPQDWHAIVWEVQPTGMKVTVDGQLRFQNQANYRGKVARVGIGPYASKVTVDYFVVEKR